MSKDMNHDKVAQLERKVAGLEGRLKKQSKILNTTTRNPQAVERERQTAGRNRTARREGVAHTATPDASRKPGGKAKPKTKGKVRSTGLGEPLAHKQLAEWAFQQAHPLNHWTAHPPLTHNAVPTHAINLGQVFCTRTGVKVSAGWGRQLSVFGKGPKCTGGPCADNLIASLQDASLFDETALHTKMVGYEAASGVFDFGMIFPTNANKVFFDGSGPHVISEIGIAGVMSNDAQLQADEATCYAAGGKFWQRLTWDRPAPLDGNALVHARWVLTGCHVEIINTTQQGVRGGSIVSVIPGQDFYNLGAGPAGIFKWADFRGFVKNYREHPVDRPARIVIPTRDQDLVFNHFEPSPSTYASTANGNSASATAYLDEAMAHFFLSNTTIADQTYDITITYDYALAGEQIAGITGPTTPTATAAPVISHVTTSSASGPLTTASEVASAFQRAASDLAHPAMASIAKAFSPASIFKMLGPP